MSRGLVTGFLATALLGCIRDGGGAPESPPRLDPRVPAEAVVAVMEHIRDRSSDRATSGSSYELRILRWKVSEPEQRCGPGDYYCLNVVEMQSVLPEKWVTALERTGFAFVADSDRVEGTSFYAIIDRVALDDQGRYVFEVALGWPEWANWEEYRVDCSGTTCAVVSESWNGVADYWLWPGSARVRDIRRIMFEFGESGNGA